MTYENILQYLQGWISSSTLDGQNFWCEVLLEDEIELNPTTTFPAGFICPVPFDMTSINLQRYVVRIYLINKTTISPNYSSSGLSLNLSNRMKVFNSMIIVAQEMVKKLNEGYPAAGIIG